MSTVLAGRVAIERLDTGHREGRPHARRRSGFLAGIARLLAAPLANAVAARRSPAHVEAALPLGRRPDRAS